MKYAFIIGSNAFVVPSKVISYRDGAGEKEFLRINSVYHDLPATENESFLEADIDIKDVDGHPVTLLANLPVMSAPYAINTTRDSVAVLRPDGTTVIHIHQLDDETAMSLEHNITAELEVNMPVVVIRINGEFMLGDIHVRAENEKLFINNNGYGNSVLPGKNQLQFTTEGVVV
jgi:hypothetical protein